MLQQGLDPLEFPGKLSLLEYVDDLSLCPMTQQVSIKDSIYLPQQLKKDNSKELQSSLDLVHYRGHNLGVNGVCYLQKRSKLIQQCPKPTAKQQLH